MNGGAILTRTKNAFKIMYANIILQIITAICGLILPGLMIREYGSEINGLVSTIRQLLTYFSVVSLGLGAASSVALYKPLAENDMNKVSSILSATRIFFNRTGYIFVALISITAFVLPVFSNSKSMSFFTITSIVLICGIGSLSEYIVISKYKILLTADQKLYILAKIQGEGVIINTILSVILIKLHASIIMVQLISTFAYILRLLLTISYVKKNYKDVNFKANPDFKSISNRWEAFSYQISGMVITYTPIIIIAMFCGYDDASIYSVYNMVFNSVAMLVGVFSSGFAASFGNLLIQKNLNSLRKSFNTFEFIFNIVLFFCYTSCLILILPFISIYVNNNDGVNYVIPAVAIIFTFSGLFKAIRVPSVTLVDAEGKFKDNKNANIIEAIANVLLSLLLVFKWGIVGIIFSSMITSFIRSLMYVYYTSKYQLKGQFLKRYSNIIFNLFLMIILSILGMNTINECKNFIQWILYAIIVSIVCLSLFLVLNCIIDKESAKDVFFRLKVVIKTRRLK